MSYLDCVWHLPPESLTLADDEVHVWRAFLDLEPHHVQGLQRTLLPGELERAGRFRFVRDRRRFIVARGVLRAILSRYLNIEPCQVRFSYNPYGKPALARGLGDDRLRFNLAHSHALALCAVTRNREVGIDLERIRADLVSRQTAEQFFSPREIAVLRSLPKAAQTAAFFHCWTRKEAYIKARGEGLSFPLDRFDVSLAPGEPAALVNTPGDPSEAARWSLKDLSPGPGYVAALAVEGHGWRLKCWQWSVE